MIVDPKTGLVEIIDRIGAKDPETKKGIPLSVKMHPVDAKEAFVRGGVLKDDNKPRFVAAEDYVTPDPA